MTNRTKITMAGARAFAAAGGREAALWDSAAPGLGTGCSPRGRERAWGRTPARTPEGVTTNRYVHLDDATLAQTAERVAMAIKLKLHGR